MRTKLVTISLVVILASGLPAVVASGATDTPLDCPGVVEAAGGWRLTQDVSGCSFDWTQDDTTLDLGGHTFTGTLLPLGDGQTVRNGTVVFDSDYWEIATDFTVSHVTVQWSPNGTCTNFCIEAGDMTVEHSTFRDFPGIALDFYFGSDGTTIRHSAFIGNRTAISIQSDSGLTIENNWFVDNDTGVNLWPEDGAGVNDTTIAGNLFLLNRTGISMSGDDSYPWAVPLLSGNTVHHNIFAGNEGAGLSIDVQCYPEDGSSCDLPADNVVDSNHFWLNGSAPTDRQPLGDDGVTARGYDHVWSPDLVTVENPQHLAGFSLARNHAYLNADLGFDVAGVTDGGRNRAWANRDPAQCLGLDCRIRLWSRADAGAAAPLLPAEPPTDQVRHEPSTPPG